MPSLKGLNCFIELTAQKKLQEFGTFYNDGLVEAFIPVPEESSSFVVRLTSSEFIAPGLAVYVFIDGVYQCNRNRQNLKLRQPLDRQSLVDFCLRQKEEKQPDGTMIARDWTFERLSIAGANEAPDVCSANVMENIGCIEVIVLRCTGSRDGSSAHGADNAAKVPAFGFDGASDVPVHHFGLDGQGPEENPDITNYDDRGTLKIQGRDGNSMRLGFDSQFGRSRFSQPNSRSHRSLYSKALRGSFTQSMESPIPGVHYGKGPIPTKSGAELKASWSQLPNSPSIIPPNESVPEPEWPLIFSTGLGNDESRRKGPPPSLQLGSATENHLPGAWPASPFGSSASPQSLRSNIDHRSVSFSPADIGLSRPASPEKAPSLTKALNGTGWDSAELTGPDSWEHSNEWSETSNDDVKHIRHTRSSTKSGWGDEPPAYTTVSGLRSEKSKSNARGTKSVRHNGSAWDSKSRVAKDHDRWSMVDDLSCAGSWASGSTVRPHTTHRPQGLNSAMYHGLKSRSQSSGRDGSKRPVWGEEYDHGWEGENTGKKHQPGSSNWVPDSPKTRSRAESIHSTTTLEMIPTPPAPTFACAVSKKEDKYRDNIQTPPAFGTDLGKFFVVSKNGRKTSDFSYSSSWDFSKDKDVTFTWGDDAVQKDATGNKQTRSSSQKESMSKKASSAESPAFPKVNSAWGETKKSATKSVSVKDKKSQLEEAIDATKGWDNGWGADWKSEPNADGIKKGSTSQGYDWGAEKGWGNVASKSKEVKSSHWNATDKDKPKSEAHSKVKGTIGSGQNTSKEKANTTDAKAVYGFHDEFKDQKEGFKADGWGSVAFGDTKPDGPKTPKPTSQRISQKGSHITEKTTYSALLTIDPKPKAHWKFPPPPPAKILRPVPEDNKSLTSNNKPKTKKPWSVPEEPLYKISKEKAEEKKLEHQVRAGKGTLYTHAIGRPEYLDTLEKPYAIFRFKYRSQAVLDKIFNQNANVKSTFKHQVPAKNPPSPEGKKDGKDADNASAATSAVGRERVRKWVEQQTKRRSADASIRTDKETHKSEEGWGAETEKKETKWGDGGWRDEQKAEKKDRDWTSDERNGGWGADTGAPAGVSW
ncbi:hypothetical protein BS50DRAFT_648548 [Corynespora cassiicola Philippines]|uniref:Uncharacterized protein n=1 Tax=Corynespora cassiicola Philippines TaxID=1448308 RepID=A0A2T2NDI5_CORCC|nr:hypothetical protein BS50DRAFT_648548 [Corynespora cassiicola Philippines]